MVGGARPTLDSFWLSGPSYTTSLPNLFIVSDTTYPGGIAGLTRSALVLADRLTR
jgi:phytoene dehydrogenase-like protein